MTDDEQYISEMRTEVRSVALKYLRQLEAVLASGKACGVVLLAVDVDGYVKSWRATPVTRAAYGDAVNALDALSATLHEGWCRVALTDADPDRSPLEVVDSSLDPEPT